MTKKQIRQRRINIRRQKLNRKLRVESLETRQLMASDFPTIESVELNADQVNPPDLERGPQLTSWQQQRSEIRSLDIRFSEPMLIAASDLQFQHLGANADVDPDTVIPLADDQLSFHNNTLTINLTTTEIPDGVLQLRVLASATDGDGNPLDGNRDELGGDAFQHSGNWDNKFYKFKSDFNGDTGVSTLDFSTFSYWYGRPVPIAPSYTDLNGDGGVGITDFFELNRQFGRGVKFPAQLAPQAAADSGSVLANQTLRLNVLANDSDDNGDDLNIVNISGRPDVLTISSTGKWIEFTPARQFQHLAAGAIEDLAFSYTISDGHSNTSTATVALTITGVPGLKPQPDFVTLSEDTPIYLLTPAIMSNDVRLTLDDELTVVAVNDVSTIGNVSLAHGHLAYSPNDKFDHLGVGETTTDTFTYTVRDNHDNSATATVTVQINGENELPSIASLGIAPENPLPSQAIAISANGVSDLDGTIQEVDFYLDVDGDDQLDTAVDQLLGIDSNGADGWSLDLPPNSFTADWHTLFATAVDDSGAQSSTKQNIQFHADNDFRIESFRADGRELHVKLAIDRPDRINGSATIAIHDSIDGQQLGREVGRVTVAENTLRNSDSHEVAVPVTIDPNSDATYLIASIVLSEEQPESNPNNNSVKLNSGVFIDSNRVLHIHGSQLDDVVEIDQTATLDVRFDSKIAVDVNNDGRIDGSDINDLTDFLNTRDATPWRNPVNPWDVDGNGSVSPTDALLVVNDVNSHGVGRPVPLDAAAIAPFLDINGDSFVNATDVIQLTNFLNRTPNAWNNSTNPLDVNQDGQVEQSDLDLIFAALDKPLPGDVLTRPIPTTSDSPFLDVNGDNLVTKLDADLILNHLRPTRGHNSLNPMDVDRNGIVNNADQSDLYDQLMRFGEGLYFSLTGRNPGFDIDADEHITWHDYDLLINLMHVQSRFGNAPNHNATSPYDVNDDGIIDEADADEIMQFLGGNVYRYEIDEVANVRIHLRDGNDALETDIGSNLRPEFQLRTHVVAGEGNDVVSGGNGNDFLDGGSGTDTIVGGGGDDILLGGDGNDILRGGSGDDIIDGQRGNDLSYGDAGDNRLVSSEVYERLYDGEQSQIQIRSSSAQLVTTGFDGQSIQVDLMSTLPNQQYTLDEIEWLLGSFGSANFVDAIDGQWARIPTAKSATRGVVFITAMNIDANGNRLQRVGTTRLIISEIPTNQAAIVNGGFEEPQLPHDGWDVFTQEELTGWDILEGPRNPGPLAEIHRGLFGGPAEGVQYLEMDGDQNGPNGTPIQGTERGSIKIGQFVDTQPGKTYRLSFDFAARPGTNLMDNVVKVVAVDTHSAATLNEQTYSAAAKYAREIAWNTQHFYFTASGSNTQISFADEGVNNTVGTFLDNVWLHKPTVDVDVDANNDGVINWADDQVTTNSRGHVVALNSGVAEVQLNVDHVSSLRSADGWKVVAEILEPNAGVKIWDSPQRLQLLGIDRLEFEPENMPGSIWVEPTRTGQFHLKLSLHAGHQTTQRPVAFDQAAVFSMAETSEDAPLAFTFHPYDTLIPIGESLLSNLGAQVLVTPAGVVHYDPTQASQLQALTAGESIEDWFYFRGQGFLFQHVPVVVHGVNDAPVITPVDDIQINPGDPLVLPIEITNIDSTGFGTGNTSQLQILEGPAGLVVDTETNTLTWQTTVDQPPQTFDIVLQVGVSGQDIDNMAGGFSSEIISVSVAATDTNHAPIYPRDIYLAIDEGELVTQSVRATELDPGQSLTYSIVSDRLTPPTATIDPSSGRLHWLSTEDDGGQSHRIVVRATDDGAGQLSATRNVWIDVAEINQAPEIRGLDQTTVAIGEVMTAYVDGFDADVPQQHLSYNLIGDVPLGLELDEAGWITWYADTSVNAGQYSVTVQVRDDGNTLLAAEKTLVIDVIPPSSPGILTSFLDTDEIYPGEEVTLAIVLDTRPDSTINQIEWYVDMNYNGDIDNVAPAADLLVATTTTGSDGIYEVTLAANDLPTGNLAIFPLVDDNYGQSGTTAPFTLTVHGDTPPNNTPPTLTVPGEVEVEAGDVANFTAFATDADGDNISYSLVFAPDHATIDDNGNFVWQTTTEQEGLRMPILVRAYDDGTPSVSALEYLILNVKESTRGPTIETIPTLTAVEGELFTYQIAEGVDNVGGAIQFQLFGNIPDTMHINSSTGAISWFPTESASNETLQLDLSATTENGAVTTVPLSLDLIEQNDAPSLAPIQPIVARPDHPVSFTAHGTDNDLPAQMLTYHLENVPSELADAVLDNITGDFYWTPTAALAGQQLAFTVAVSDSDGAVARQQAKIHVDANVGSDLRLSPLADIVVHEGNWVNFVATTTEPFGGRLIYSLVNEPAIALSATLNPNSGQFDWP
ncbi:MAG: VCBS repeat-containing protein, partial [Pirellulaceae bacterium]